MGRTIALFDQPLPDGARAADVFGPIVERATRSGTYTIDRPNPDTLVVSRKSSLRFGLLSLVTGPSKEERITVTVEQIAGGGRVSAVGEGGPSFVTELEAYLTAPE